MEFYQSRPALLTRIDFDTLAAGIVKDSSASGFLSFWKTSAGVRRRVSYLFNLMSRREINAHRALFARNNGRLNGLWLPIFLNEAAIESDQLAGDFTVTVRYGKLGFALERLSQFAHLVIMTRTTLECHGIASVSVNGDAETVTLSEALEANLSASSTICGGLMFVRAMDDLIEYEYQTSEIADCRMDFIELPNEYSAAIDGTKDVFLYKFTKGGLICRFTGWPAAVSSGGNEWGNLDIEHTAISSSTEFVPGEAELWLQTTDKESLFRSFLYNDDTEPVLVEIYKTDRRTLESVSLIYSGRVNSVEFKALGEITCKLSTLERMDERDALKLLYQRTCNHRVFDSNCGLTETAFQIVGVLTAISSSYVEATEFGDEATTRSDSNWFALGKITVGTETRMITGQVGNRLYLNAAFRRASVGDSATATPGCDGRIQTCSEKFSNVAQTVQFPLMPNQHPQFTALATPKASGGKK